MGLALKAVSAGTGRSLQDRCLLCPALERSIRWDDPSIGVNWPLVGQPILSPKDAAAGSLRQAIDELASANA
ncbi:MAG: dTDP-4-dehydrorhamnose 3,5-epimerase [Alphaproteobacteria bacterium]|nr:dTDP-4-dehydrorhamnose 3,5-epimerase [Alphaproteobacteria bacterium]MBU1561618.1 dTDP-4-dehydrorhamnose 3,5-epimerase [Alphaproteobacteria bacterium]MBU2302401.1 dTDP-4-dehydrorhamnose 3,5-epimerase [Alphaproteobacteria bacterium]MBU2368681.1 dTDP-4-dehydrorhamnose 3,5-epimerase [Alphaproteobacteria bacterium]